MEISSLVQEASQKLHSLCESYESQPLVQLSDLEETVKDLEQKVQAIDLASDQSLKKELNGLQSILLKFTTILDAQKEALSHQMEEIHMHQLALQAYAQVANHNLGAIR